MSAEYLVTVDLISTYDLISVYADSCEEAMDKVAEYTVKQIRRDGTQADVRVVVRDCVELDAENLMESA